jgi:tRNA-2-methylthio-N6-dimethylallyladenosine synthase
VLVERAAKKGAADLAGRTENNRWVNFPGPTSLLQRFVDVIVTEARPHSLRGRFVDAQREASGTCAA